MDVERKLTRCAGYLHDTYLQSDLQLDLSLEKGPNDTHPKKTGLHFVTHLNLAQLALIGSGVLLTACVLHEFRKKSREQKIMKKLEKRMAEQKAAEQQ